MQPLTNIDCDLRDFAFMPLDVVRLRDSDLAALESPEACWAAVLLWCASWHQIPAASLPNDDRVLANLAGFGRVVKEWMKVKDGSLRGWVKCDDGRLYHPVIAEKANEAWKRKLEQLWKTELARIKKHNQRHPENPAQFPDFEQWLSQRTNATCPQGQHASVTNMSEEKPNPIDREMDMDIDIDNLSKESDKNINPVASSGNSSLPSTPLGEVCKALVRSGLPPFNQSHQKLLTLIEAGATPEEFYDTAIEIKAKADGKFKFEYILSVVAGRRADVASLVLHTGNLPKQQTATDKRTKAGNDMLGMFKEQENGRIIDVSERDANQTDRPALLANG